MKWLKVVWHFVLRHLPRWLHIAAHEVAEYHKDCSECSVDYPTVESCDYCRDCDLYEDCKWYDEQVKGDV